MGFWETAQLSAESRKSPLGFYLLDSTSLPVDSRSMSDGNPYLGSRSSLERGALTPRRFFLAATALALLGLLLMAGSLWLRIDAGQDASRLTATSVGTVLPGAESVSYGDQAVCTVSYSFLADSGESIQAEAVEQTDCGEAQEEGAERTVYYAPGNPADSSLVDPALKLEETPWREVFLGGSLAILGAGVLMVLGSLRARRGTPSSPDVIG